MCCHFFFPDYGNIDKYKSTFRRIIFNSGFNLSDKTGILKNINLNLGVNSQFDELKRTKLVSPQRAAIAPSSIEPGEYSPSHENCMHSTKQLL